MEVVELTVTSVAAVGAERRRAVAPVKLVPVMVTVVPPRSGPGRADAGDGGRGAV